MINTSWRARFTHQGWLALGKPLWLAGAVGMALFGITTSVSADDPRFGANDVRTVFSISKSDDRNQVQYGIHLDTNCVPVGDEPVYAYWRQFERGPNVTEDLNWMDRTVYSVRRQKVVTRGGPQSRVDIELKATAKRTIAVVSRKTPEGRCVAEAYSAIGSVPSAHLDRIFVQLGGLMGVKYIDIVGRDLEGHPVSERAKP